MQINTRDAAAGVIFLTIAGLFAYGTTDLAIGTAFRMGPGYFPLVLSVILGLLGLLIVFKAVGQAPSPLTGVPWRGLILILLAPIVFGLTIRGTALPGLGVAIPNLGLAPATALVVAISAFASRRATLAMAAGLTVGLTIFCVAVFSYGLSLPIPRLGPAFQF